MINSVGRDIPDDLLAGGRQVYRGAFYRNNSTYRKAAPTVRGLSLIHI